MDVICSKLSHSLHEVRERSLANLLSKLEHGIWTEAELIQDKRLLKVLLEWFNFRPCSREVDVLELLIRLASRPNAGANLVSIGAIPFLALYRRDCPAQVRPLIDRLVDRLFQVESAALEAENDFSLCRYLSASQSEKREKPNEPPTTEPLSNGTGTSYDSLPKSSTSSIGDTLTRGYFKSTEPGQPDGSPANVAFVGSTEACFRDCDFVWLPLTSADLHVLKSTEQTLQSRDVTVVVAACEFLYTVVFNDFPPEVFLQRSTIVKPLVQLLDAAKPYEIVASALQAMLKLLSCLEAQIDMKHNDPELHSNKQLESSVPPASTPAPVQLAGDTGAPIKNSSSGDAGESSSVRSSDALTVSASQTEHSGSFSDISSIAAAEPSGSPRLASAGGTGGMPKVDVTAGANRHRRLAPLTSSRSSSSSRDAAQLRKTPQDPTISSLIDSRLDVDQGHDLQALQLSVVRFLTTVLEQLSFLAVSVDTAFHDTTDNENVKGLYLRNYFCVKNVLRLLQRVVTPAVWFSVVLDARFFRDRVFTSLELLVDCALKLRARSVASLSTIGEQKVQKTCFYGESVDFHSLYLIYLTEVVRSIDRFAVTVTPVALPRISRKILDACESLVYEPRTMAFTELEPMVALLELLSGESKVATYGLVQKCRASFLAGVRLLRVADDEHASCEEMAVAIWSLPLHQCWSLLDRVLAVVVALFPTNSSRCAQLMASLLAHADPPTRIQYYERVRNLVVSRLNVDGTLRCGQPLELNVVAQTNVITELIVYGALNASSGRLATLSGGHRQLIHSQRLTDLASDIVLTLLKAEQLSPCLELTAFTKRVARCFASEWLSLLMLCVDLDSRLGKVVFEYVTRLPLSDWPAVSPITILLFHRDRRIRQRAAQLLNKVPRPDGPDALRLSVDQLEDCCVPVALMADRAETSSRPLPLLPAFAPSVHRETDLSEACQLLDGFDLSTSLAEYASCVGQLSSMMQDKKFHKLLFASPAHYRDRIANGEQPLWERLLSRFVRFSIRSTETSLIPLNDDQDAQRRAHVLMALAKATVCWSEVFLFITLASPVKRLELAQSQTFVLALVALVARIRTFALEAEQKRKENAQQLRNGHLLSASLLSVLSMQDLNSKVGFVPPDVPELVVNKFEMPFQVHQVQLKSEFYNNDQVACLRLLGSNGQPLAAESSESGSGGASLNLPQPPPTEINCPSDMIQRNLQIYWNTLWHADVSQLAVSPTDPKERAPSDGLLAAIKTDSIEQSNRFSSWLHLQPFDRTLLPFLMDLGRAFQVLLDDFRRSRSHETAGPALERCHYMLLVLITRFDGFPTGSGQEYESVVDVAIGISHQICVATSRFFEVTPQSSVDIWLLNRIYELVRAYVAFLGRLAGQANTERWRRCRKATDWLGRLIVRDSGSSMTLFAGEDQRWRDITMRLLKFGSTCLPHMDMPAMGALSFCLLQKLSLPETPRFYNLGWLQFALECLVQVTAHPLWAMGAPSHDQVQLSERFVTGLTEIMSAFHVGKIGLLNSFMGGGVTLSCALALLNIVRWCPPKTDWYSRLLNTKQFGNEHESNGMQWIVPLLLSRDTRIRASGLGLLVALTTSPESTAFLSRNAPFDVWSVAVNVLLDDTDASLVRRNAGLVLINLCSRWGSVLRPSPVGAGTSRDKNRRRHGTQSPSIGRSNSPSSSADASLASVGGVSSLADASTEALCLVPQVASGETIVGGLDAFHLILDKTDFYDGLVRMFSNFYPRERVTSATRSVIQQYQQSQQARVERNEQAVQANDHQESSANSLAASPISQPSSNVSAVEAVPPTERQSPSQGPSTAAGTATAATTTAAAAAAVSDSDASTPKTTCICTPLLLAETFKLLRNFILLDSSVVLGNLKKFRLVGFILNTVFKVEHLERPDLCQYYCELLRFLTLCSSQDLMLMDVVLTEREFLQAVVVLLVELLTGVLKGRPQFDVAAKGCLAKCCQDFLLFVNTLFSRDPRRTEATLFPVLQPRLARLLNGMCELHDRFTVDFELKTAFMQFLTRVTLIRARERSIGVDDRHVKDWQVVTKFLMERVAFANYGNTVTDQIKMAGLPRQFFEGAAEQSRHLRVSALECIKLLLAGCSQAKDLCLELGFVNDLVAITCELLEQVETEMLSGAKVSSTGTRQRAPSPRVIANCLLVLSTIRNFMHNCRPVKQAFYAANFGRHLQALFVWSQLSPKLSTCLINVMQTYTFQFPNGCKQLCLDSNEVALSAGALTAAAVATTASGKLLVSQLITSLDQTLTKSSDTDVFSRCESLVTIVCQLLSVRPSRVCILKLPTFFREGTFLCDSLMDPTGKFQQLLTAKQIDSKTTGRTKFLPAKVQFTVLVWLKFFYCLSCSEDGQLFLFSRCDPVLTGVLRVLLDSAVALHPTWRPYHFIALRNLCVENSVKMRQKFSEKLVQYLLDNAIETANCREPCLSALLALTSTKVKTWFRGDAERKLKHIYLLVKENSSLATATGNGILRQRSLNRQLPSISDDLRDKRGNGGGGDGGDGTAEARLFSLLHQMFLFLSEK